MCGIAGKVDFAGPVDQSLIHGMCAAMEHRGPDSRGVWCADGVGLGIQRLAIIDVAGGDQPIFNEDRSVVVVMNGEIYNFEELRRQLRRRGHTFATRSDTEVLVHLYEDHGERLVERLHGMFAFAIWDRRRRQLLLARDRVGKKPLFVARRGSKVWFASEMMSLLQDPELSRTPDPQAIIAYLALQYVPQPMTAFVGVEKLAPASTLAVSAEDSHTRTYWELDYETEDRPADPRALQEELRDLIWESTRTRLVSEVPLGAFLSGGIDSSAVVAAMADQTTGPVRTFSIGFPEASFDELRYARIVAERFATDHQEFVVEPHALDIMPKLARHYGEPFADPSAIPSFYLARLTSDYVTVALNGDGGDESFAGYGRYASNRFLSYCDWIPESLRGIAPAIAQPLGEGGLGNSWRTRIQRLAGALAMHRSARYAHWMSAFPLSMREHILDPDFARSIDHEHPERLIGDAWRASSAATIVDRMLATDVKTFLPGDLLVKMDIATMAYSLEARSPFLDHRLMEFAAKLPTREKLRGTSGKMVLKAALRGILPDEILDRPKMGFGVPLAHWFRTELRNLPAEMLLAGDSRVHAYIKPAAVAKMIDEHHSAQSDHSLRLWVLLQLEHWHRQVVEAPSVEPSEALSRPGAAAKQALAAGLSLEGTAT